jgi:hypothetical protein
MAKKIEVLTAREVAQRLGCSATWVRMVCRERNIPPTHGVKGHVCLYDASQVADLSRIIQEIAATAREKRAVHGKTPKNLAHLDEVRMLRRASRQARLRGEMEAPLFPPEAPEAPEAPAPLSASPIETQLTEISSLLNKVIDRLAAVERSWRYLSA